MENAKQQTGVPENAFRELKKGEQYAPQTKRIRK